LELINGGVIDANDSTPLTLSGLYSSANTGTMEASNGGTLIQTGGSLNNKGGTIEAQSGSTVELENSTAITGGLVEAIGGDIYLAGGTITGSKVLIEKGSTLSGSGTVSNTIIASKGKVNPGINGVINVNGNLTFALSSASYVVDYSPTSAASVNVTGTASLDGDLHAVAATGTYSAGQQYTVLAASGGITGSFNLIPSGKIGKNLVPVLVYSADDVYLDIDVANMSALLPKMASPAARTVAGAIDKAISDGDTIPQAIEEIGSFSAPQAARAMSMLQGDGGGGLVEAGLQSADSFLSLLAGRSFDTMSDAEGSSTANAAIGQRQIVDTSFDALSSQNSTTPLASNVRLWSAFFGDGVAQPAPGQVATGLAAGNEGYADGLEVELLPDTLVGVAFAQGLTTFGWGASSLGMESKTTQVGMYGTASLDSLYASAAIGMTHHHMLSDYSSDSASAENAGSVSSIADIGGRFEFGYRLTDASFTIAPFVAGETQKFDIPQFDEAVSIDSNAINVAYTARAISDTRAQLGVWIQDAMPLPGQGLLNFEGRVAYEHEWLTGNDVTAVVANLTDAPFAIQGATPFENAALVSVGTSVELSNHLSFGVKADGLLGDHAQTYVGSASIQWAF
jgi:uncharacterized protein with beta-barrel porin domain